MFCSTIIPTVGRTSLARAVESVLCQSIPGEEFEILVINDSGNPLPEADWQRSERVQVIHTNRRERSVARNTGAAAARGRYLHFLDDDDHLFPDAYQHLWSLSQSSDAIWLYGATQLTDRQEHPSIQLWHHLTGNCFVEVMSGEWIPLQSSWIDRNAFMRVGGFNPLLAGPEDIDLLRRILLDEQVDETPHLIARVIMGGEGSTTDYANHSTASRWARESILNMPNVHARMHASAKTPLWKGRILRIYLTSTLWNIKEFNPLTALSRLSQSLGTLMLARTSLLSGNFWSAVRNPYASLTFEKGFQEIKTAKQIEH